MKSRLFPIARRLPRKAVCPSNARRPPPPSTARRPRSVTAQHGSDVSVAGYPSPDLRRLRGPSVRPFGFVVRTGHCRGALLRVLCPREKRSADAALEDPPTLPRATAAAGRPAPAPEAYRHDVCCLVFTLARTVPSPLEGATSHAPP